MRLKKFLALVFVLFFGVNLIAVFHAYKFTNYSDGLSKTKNPTSLKVSEKIKAALFGVNNPRPKTEELPSQIYTTIYIGEDKSIEAWHITIENAKGTVILFHGYSSSKSSLIKYSNQFIKLGYNTLLVDLMGSGGSKGNVTTIGYKEANQVRICFEHIIGKGESNVHLFGVSMGAVSIMKAINDFEIKPKSILLECPFGNLLATVQSRFSIMGIPSFPMANLLTFWGGAINGFWAFDYNPIEYATQIECPSLILYGDKDQKVSRPEILEMYSNLSGRKELKVFPDAAHDNILKIDELEWLSTVSNFMGSAESH